MVAWAVFRGAEAYSKWSAVIETRQNCRGLDARTAVVDNGEWVLFEDLGAFEAEAEKKVTCGGRDDGKRDDEAR